MERSWSFSSSGSGNSSGFCSSGSCSRGSSGSRGGRGGGGGGGGGWHGQLPRLPLWRHHRHRHHRRSRPEKQASHLECLKKPHQRHRNWDTSSFACSTGRCCLQQSALRCNLRCCCFCFPAQVHPCTTYTCSQVSSMNEKKS